MDVHLPTVTDISENPAKAASVAANPKAALEQSNGNTQEPHREAGDMLAGAASDAVEHASCSGEALASVAGSLANMRVTRPPRQPRRCSDRHVVRAIASRVTPQPIR